LACVLGYVFDNPMYPFYYRFIIFEFVMVISSVPCLPSVGSRPLRLAARLPRGARGVSLSAGPLVRGLLAVATHGRGT